MTKKQLGLFRSYHAAYMRGAKTELGQVYGSYSYAKEKAMKYCRELQERLGGYHATIVGHSCHFFSYAFLYWDADTKRECLCYCTQANDYKFPID